MASLTLVTIGDAGILARVENTLLDARFRLRPSTPVDNRIVVLAVDDGSIDRIGRWVWSRAVFARVLDRLTRAHPRLVAFDMLFIGPEPEADADFARAIAAASPVLLPFSAIPAQAGAPPPPPVPAWMSEFEYGRVRGDYRMVPHAPGMRLPEEALARSATALGHVDAPGEPTGAFRYDFAMLRVGDALYPSFVTEAVRILRDVSRPNVVVDPEAGIDIGGLWIPTGPGMKLMVDAYPPGHFPTVSVADLLEGRVSDAALAGRLVLIGATASAVGDHFLSPFDPALPGVYRNAAAIAGLLDGHMLRHDDTTLFADVLIVLVACLSIGGIARRSLRRALVVALALLFVVLPAIDIVAFNWAGWWLNAVIPLVAVAATGVVLIVLQQGRGASALREVWAASRRDTLTGLPNRAGLRAWVDDAAGARHLVCAADLDGFKQVNDRYGHPAGDELLCEVAARLRQSLRPGDLASRIGGDEFVLALRAPARADDRAAWQALHDAFARVSRPYPLRDGLAEVGVSMGTAMWPDDDQEWSRVLEMADAALYEAKRAGKGRIAGITPEPRDVADSATV